MAGVFFEQPDLPGLVHDQEGIADPRNLAEPDQPGTNVARLVDERVREPQFFGEERAHRDWFGQLRDVHRHPAMACERRVRLLERDEILDEIGEFLL